MVELCEPGLCLVLLLTEADEQLATPLQGHSGLRLWWVALGVEPVAKVLHRLARMLDPLKAKRG